MEPRKPGNEQMPDFHELEDRIIAQPSSQPTLVIKTKLDPKDVTEQNLYHNKKNEKDSQSFQEFFE
jgi:hypothetical protein